MCCNGVVGKATQFKTGMNEKSWGRISCQLVVDYKCIAINSYYYRIFFIRQNQIQSFFLFWNCNDLFLTKIINFQSMKEKCRRKGSGESPYYFLRRHKHIVSKKLCW